MTVLEFAERVGVAFRTIYNLQKRCFFPPSTEKNKFTERDVNYFKKHYLMEGYYSNKEMCNKINVKPTYMKHLMEHGFWDGMLPIKNKWNGRLYWKEEHIEYYKKYRHLTSVGAISEIEYNGQKMSKKEFSERIRIPYDVVKNRFRNEWTVEEISKYPVLKKTKIRSLLFFEDKYYTRKEFAELIGMSEKTVSNYVRRGFNCEEIIEMVNNKHEK